MLYTVMYHYVRDLKNSRYPEIKGLDLDLFREQVRFFKKEFNIVTMENVIDAYDNKCTLPERAVLLTFDDGYIDHYSNVFPVLMEERVQGSFFISGKTYTEHKLLDVNKIHFVLASADIKELEQDLLEQMDYYRGSEYCYASNEELYKEFAVPNRFDDKDTIFVKRMLQTVLPEELRNILSSKAFAKYVGMEEEKFARELYMSREQLSCMKQCGMYIGAHGYDHYWLGRLDQAKMQQDISQGLEALKGLVDPDNWVMNYPYGSYSEDVIELLKTNGCRLGLTTEVGTADPLKDNRFRVPRFDTNDFPPKSENYKKYM